MKKIRVVSNQQGICPLCNSEDLNYGALNLEDDMVYYPCTCNKCGQDLEEWYSLQFSGFNAGVDMVEVEVGQQIIIDSDNNGEEDYGCDCCGARIPIDDVNWFASTVGFCDKCDEKLYERIPREVLEVCCEEVDAGNDKVAQWIVDEISK